MHIFFPLTRLAICLLVVVGHGNCAAALAARRAQHHSLPQANTENAGPRYALRADAMAFADVIATRSGLDPAWVRQTIGNARLQPLIAQAMAPAPGGVAKNWRLYRSRFVEPVRIQAGARFWRTNRKALDRAEQATGVPAAIIVGIIGVETLFGQQTGKYRVIDALCTLSFDFPPSHPRATERSAFFASELEAYLRLTQRTGTDPMMLRGSYAGAMGLPQFMPSSWDRYAVDFDGDGRIDLFHSAADVIGSVANYFSAFHWQAGMPTHFPLRLDTDNSALPELLASDIQPRWSAMQMTQSGAILSGPAAQYDGALALIALENGEDTPLYIAGTDNFYAITRYNWSSYYALAVIELGEEIARAVGSTGAVPK
jgi:membrane-bound lytic murein transglycosylase B